MVKKQQKKKRLRLRIKVVLKLLLFICIVALSIYYLAKLNIKNINISGNEQIKDVTIIETLGIKDFKVIIRGE
jgi:cell division septal protein FtsQ